MEFKEYRIIVMKMYLIQIHQADFEQNFIHAQHSGKEDRSTNQLQASGRVYFAKVRLASHVLTADGQTRSLDVQALI